MVIKYIESNMICRLSLSTYYRDKKKKTVHPFRLHPSRDVYIPAVLFHDTIPLCTSRHAASLSLLLSTRALYCPQGIRGDLSRHHLRYWSLNKMAAILQTTFSSVFSWMKSLVFWFKFHLNCFCGFNWQHVSIDSGNGLAPYRRQAITWTNVDLVTDA